MHLNLFSFRPTAKFFVLFLLIACKTTPTDLFKLKLKTINGVSYPLQQLISNRASVLVFLSPDCPMCQNYSLTLNQLYDKYKTDDVQFYGLFTGNNFDPSEIKKFAEDYKIKFDALMDEDKQLLSLLKANVTPEVFVVNPVGSIMYKGSIDNWLHEPGHKRTVITAHYLDEALHSFVSNTEIKIKSTEAKGCLIE